MTIIFAMACSELDFLNDCFEDEVCNHLQAVAVLKVTFCIKTVMKQQ